MKRAKSKVSKGLPPLETRMMECRFDGFGGDGHHLSGYAVIFESPAEMGGFTEYFARGSLDAADLSDVRLIVGHDLTGIPIARSRAGSKLSTMTLTVDDVGLRFDADIDVDHNAQAAALHSAVGRGDVTGVSVRFGVDSEEWTGLDTPHPVRVIKAVRSIVEISAVIMPAYKSTEIEARGEDPEGADDALERAEAKAGIAAEAAVTSDELGLLKAKSAMMALM